MERRDLVRDGIWIVRYCANTGCGVRIRELVSNQGAGTCKWCQQGIKLSGARPAPVLDYDKIPEAYKS